MRRCELLELVKPLGCSEPTLNYLLLSGKLGPIALDTHGNRFFTPKHLAAVVTYVGKPRKRGRKPRPSTSAKQTRRKSRHG